jgi:hypothetical protein
MFNFRETKFVPGFRVSEPKEEVPGFRLAPDGSIRQSSADVASSTDPGFIAPESWMQPRPMFKPESANNLAFLGGGLAGMAGSLAPQALQDVEPVAAGDYKCQACGGGRHSGMTGAYQIGGRILCHKCAVKRLGFGNEPSSDLPTILQPFSLKPK